MTPEDMSMVQGLYSRDPRSVEIHLEKVKQVGSGNFMNQYYVGYGHKSIGDCGSTTLFIENVSMLVAKAVQDWPLYNGQEASTRYLDMSKQEVLNPLNNKQGEEIQKAWMDFYQKILAALIEHLPSRFPIKEGEDEKLYKKAIKAKAFDVARGFLPAGVTTLVSWHTNLRQAHDHLKEMNYHPLHEVREVAVSLHKMLDEKYPNSFKHKVHEEDEKYLSETIPAITYDTSTSQPFKARNLLHPWQVNSYSGVLKSRPALPRRNENEPLRAASELSNKLRICGNICFEFQIDFGSFRDFQRQRSVVQTMPLLKTEEGFHEWYLSQLPEDLRIEAVEFLKNQEEKIAMLDGSPEEKQYYVGMGYKVSCYVAAPLPAAVYIAELRTQQTVHPTLREIAKKLGQCIKEYVPYIALYCDNREDEWSSSRGKQDIVEKSA